MEEVIHFGHVSKQLGGRTILDDVDLSVESGDVFGFLGPNGAGKTTSIRLVLGLFLANSGKVSVLGHDPSEDVVRKRVGFVLEGDGLYDNVTAFDNLAYYGRLYAVPQVESRIAKMLALAGLSDRASDKVGTFSKGMRQRLAIARAMLHDPDLLILDEPTAGIDPAGQVEVRKALLDLVEEGGKSVFLSSHNLDEVQRICNRVALIHRGQIRLAGDLNELEQQMSRGEVTIETITPIASALLDGLGSLPGITVVGQSDATLSLRVSTEAALPPAVTFLATNGAEIIGVKRQQAGLEEMYLSSMGEAESNGHE